MKKMRWFSNDVEKPKLQVYEDGLWIPYKKSSLYTVFLKVVGLEYFEPGFEPGFHFAQFALKQGVEYEYPN